MFVINKDTICKYNIEVFTENKNDYDSYIYFNSHKCILDGNFIRFECNEDILEADKDRYAECIISYLIGDDIMDLNCTYNKLPISIRPYKHNSNKIIFVRCDEISGPTGPDKTCHIKNVALAGEVAASLEAFIADTIIVSGSTEVTATKASPLIFI